MWSLNGSKGMWNDAMEMIKVARYFLQYAAFMTIACLLKTSQPNHQRSPECVRRIREWEAIRSS